MKCKTTLIKKALHWEMGDDVHNWLLFCQTNKGLSFKSTAANIDTDIKISWQDVKKVFHRELEKVRRLQLKRLKSLKNA